MKSERERQIPYDVTYTWNLIYGTNEPFHRKKIMDMENRLVVAKGGGSGMEWEAGINRHKLLHLELISNEILLYSRGNYIQSLVMEHDGG